VLVIATNAGLAIDFDSSQLPYDGSDDTLVGVLNSSSRQLSNVTLSGPDGTFNFDGDGICTYEINDCNQSDSSGYAGPGVTFSAIDPDNQAFGTINFNPPLPPDGTAYFSLEQLVTPPQIVQAQLAASGVTLTAVAGLPVKAPIATFTDSNTSDAAALFSATIDWGDGTTSVGSVSGGNGSFSVSGQHTYSGTGTDIANISITESGSSAGALTSSTITVKSSLNYVALGDSYSSGEGNPPFVPSAGKCDRSKTHAWPELLATKASDLNLVALLACSGAKISALTNAYKGETPQLYAMTALKPDLVTITIGGNDVGFSDILRNCYVIHLRHENCVTDGTLKQAKANVVALGGIISGVYNALETEAPHAMILVVGYPQLFPNSQKQTTGCGWLDNSERAQLNSLAQLLDSEMSAAASGIGVQYVSTLNVMAGHELCSAHSWFNKIVPLNNGAGHPNFNGQKALAAAVSAKLTALGL